MPFQRMSVFILRAAGFAALLSLFPCRLDARIVYDAPLWASDGAALAFIADDPAPSPVAGRSSTRSLYVVGLLGNAFSQGWAEPTRIASAQRAAWLLDGKRIVATVDSTMTGSHPSTPDTLMIYTVRGDAAEPRPVYAAVEGVAIVDVKVISRSGAAVVRLGAVDRSQTDALPSPSGALMRVNLIHGTTDALVEEPAILDFDIDPFGGFVIALDSARGLLKISLTTPVQTVILFDAASIQGRDSVRIGPGADRCVVFSSDINAPVPPVYIPDIGEPTLRTLTDAPRGLPDYSADGSLVIVSGSTLYTYNDKKASFAKAEHPSGPDAALVSLIAPHQSMTATLDRRGLAVVNTDTRRSIIAPITPDGAVRVAERLIADNRLDSVPALCRLRRLHPAYSVSEEQATARLWELEAIACFRLNDLPVAANALEHALLLYPVRRPVSTNPASSDADKKPSVTDDTATLLRKFVDGGATSELLPGLLEADLLIRSRNDTLAGKFYEKLGATTGDPLLAAGLAFKRGEAYLKARKVLPAARAFDIAGQQPGYPQADIAKVAAVCCQWMHPDKKWNQDSIKIAKRLAGTTFESPRSASLTLFLKTLDTADKQQKPYEARPIEAIIPGRPPETLSSDGVLIKGPPEPNGVLLCVSDWRYVLALSPARGVDLVLEPYSRVFFKLPDGKNGEIELPMRVDSIAVHRDSETAAFLSRRSRGGETLGVAAVVRLTKNEIVQPPLAYRNAVSVSLGRRGFVLKDSDGETLRILNFPRYKKSETGK
ncbi:MAG: hypothetical protein ABIH86_01265 [Planctomycetota bacterium]